VRKRYPTVRRGPVPSLISLAAPPVTSLPPARVCRTVQLGRAPPPVAPLPLAECAQPCNVGGHLLLQSPVLSRGCPTVQRGRTPLRVPLSLQPLISNPPTGNQLPHASRAAFASFSLRALRFTIDVEHSTLYRTPYLINRAAPCVPRFAPRRTTRTAPHIPHRIDPNTP
jgi:hypothetical protein